MKGLSLRFISPISAYKVVAIHEKTEVLADGSRRTLAPGFTAHFNKFDTTDWERDIAREKFKFRNIVKNLDGSMVDPVPRTSSFDTATIEDPELRKRVEEALLNNPDHGKQEGYLLVEKPKVKAPWASYDKLTIQGRRTAELVAQKNLEIAAETGTPIQDLIAYERSLDEPRGELIALYEAALPVEPDPEPDLIAA
jgi:hypothetical protein